MNASDYQKQAARTLIDRPDFELTEREWSTIINSVLLAASAGGIAEMVKKGIFHRHGLDDLKIRHHIREVERIAALFLRSRLAQIPPRLAITDQMVMVIWNVIGLLGEAGEIAALVMDGLNRGRFDKEKFQNEIGDLLWYAAALCTKLGIDLGEAMQANTTKLLIRYPNGYSSADSQKRVDVKGGLNGN